MEQNICIKVALANKFQDWQIYAENCDLYFGKYGKLKLCYLSGGGKILKSADYFIRSFVTFEKQEKSRGSVEDKVRGGEQ